MFKTLKEGQVWIESVQKFGDKYDLTRMHYACEMLGHPEKAFKSIHIGGTNGKGSTLTFLKHILLEAGYSVGTYTSPYIVHFNERITLNNQQIEDDILLQYINEIYLLQETYKDKYNDQITFFELVTLISFMYFKDTQPDIALIEVGLGGTLDATNVITPLVSVITTIGFDHMNVLGNTLESIAGNKLGIVKDSVPLIAGITQKELFPQFSSHAKLHDAPLTFLADYPVEPMHLGMPSTFTFLEQDYKMHMVGVHQVANAKLALLAANTLTHYYEEFSVPEKAKKQGIEHAFWPGRFEVFGNVILDGAHNPEGLKACLETVSAYFKNKKVISLFTVMQDKDYEPMLKMLEDKVDEIIFTEIPYPRCELAEVLLNKSNHSKKQAIKNYEEAFNRAKPKTSDELLIVTGSLYFISAIRKLLS